MMMFLVSFNNRLVSVAGTRRDALVAAANKLGARSLADWRVIRRSLTVSCRDTNGFGGKIRLKIDESKIQVVR